MPRAFITGISGQDGSYLADLLLEKGYEVHGLVRHVSTYARPRLDHLRKYEHGTPKRLFLHYGDLLDSLVLTRLLREIQPDEIYNLAAQSHVRVSFEMPEHTADVTGTGVMRLLEAIRQAGQIRKVRYYQASSSEMFGKVLEVPQRETTPFYPRSPYACAKVFAHYATVNYRESYGLFGCSGILFNHESPRRGENFVTRKITRAAARIKLGQQSELMLGNLEAKRDWGFAKEYVEGMWRMLQQDKPDDYVLATGETWSVKDFLDATFEHLNLDWHDFVKFDPRQVRPAEVDLLIGDYSKAEKQLGWVPQTKVKGLAALMADADLELAKREGDLPPPP